MIVALAVAASVLLLLPGVTDRLGRRLSPREWAWLCALALGAGGLLVETALALRAAPGVLRAAGIPSVAAACERLLGSLAGGSQVVTWVTAAATIMLPAAALLATGRERRMRHRVAADLWLGEWRTVGGHAVLVLPTSRPMALSFEDTERVIVVSDGLLDLLGPEEAAAVVRHEASHLAHHHQRLLTVAGSIDPVLGRLPVIRRSVGALRLAVERWADEDAGGAAPGARDAVRTSLLRLAGLQPELAGAARFAEARTVAARLAALEAPPPAVPPAGHLLLYLPGTVALLVAAPALYRWGDGVQTVLGIAGRCTI